MKDGKGEPIALTTKTGNLMYRAPELLDENTGQYSENIDVSFHSYSKIWSLGACFYFMLTGKHLFCAQRYFFPFPNFPVKRKSSRKF